MSTNADITKTRFAPTLVAPETFLIHDHHGEGTEPVAVGLNSLVIRAKEPVVVDTGMPANREQYLADVFGLVDPEDIRWVFISHDDVDHVGNLDALLDAAPNATVVTTWFMIERMGDTMPVPPSRWRWVRDGESFDVGDRVLHAVRPPVFDSPTTRGLFDPSTGFYWASDSFATPMLAPTNTVAGFDRDFWGQGIATFAQYISPWLSLVDGSKFQQTVDRVQALGVTGIAGCHTPFIDAAHVRAAFDLMRAAPSVTVEPEPGQALLDQILDGLLLPA
jgi:flavorubredoxin